MRAGQVLILVLSLLVAGCSGGGGGGGTPPTTPQPDGGGGGGGGGSPPVQGWNPSVLVSNLRGNSIEMFTPAVALTGPGVGFMAWTERGLGTNCARTWVNRTAARTWGRPTVIGVEQAVAPAIAANANGDAVLVWIERGFSTESCGGTVLGQEIWASSYSAASNT